MNPFPAPQRLNFDMTTKVLVVDDDPVVRILVGECLSAKGYDVTAVECGSECFKSMAENQPDVVVLDFYMPEMTGMDILIRMKKDPSLAKLPILMLSADSNSQKLLKEHNVAPDAFLQKPVGLDEVLKAVRGISGVES